ncbi:MAG: HlyC/CorC family transporter [Xanthomonadaceae bacterium]|nr:HlyC/CorC family transporter [Xanthomonadaceae bacterium]
MDDIPLTTLVISLIGLLMLSAFFSGSETALMTINRYRLLHLARSGVRGAQLAQKLLERPDRLIGLILLGNNFVNILAAGITTVVFMRLVGEAGVFVGSMVLTVVVLIFAEVAPKTLAAFKPERVALPASFVLWPLMKVAYPVVWVINLLAGVVLRLFGHRDSDKDDGEISQDELRTLLEHGGSLIPASHRKMFLNILALEEARVEDIMVPRNEIVGIDLDDDPAELPALLAEFPFSRAVVYRDTIDQVEGVLNLRDLVDLRAGTAITPALVVSRLRKPYFIPEGARLTQQLAEFQRQRRRLALVVDEYGDIAGLVTLADILEEIVGEFTSEPKQNTRRIEHQPDGSILVDGRIAVHSLNRRLDFNLPTEDANTLSGLIVNHLESLPLPGTGLEIEGYRMTVEEVQDNVVRKVRMYTADSAGAND